jgi:sulfofructose kinase
MRAKSILCVGALTCDLVLQVPALPTGAGKLMASRSTLVAAGMAASAATAIARLGHQVSLWASVGGDRLGDHAIAEMALEGIDTRFVRIVHGASSAVAAIIVDSNGERMVIPHYEAAILARPANLPPFADFGAVLADVRWPAAAALALDAARELGRPAILDLDAGPPEDLSALAARATHVIGSLQGATLLTGETKPEECIKALRRFTSAALLAVTDGERGVWFSVGDGGIGHIPAFAVNAVDTNAAGDIFHGAFAVALDDGHDPVAALRFASAAAAIKCTRYGGRTGAPTRDEVSAFMARRPVDS